MNLGLDWLIRFIPGNIDKKFTKGTDSLREICYQFIREKRESQKGSREETTDILSKLMDTNEFSDEELVDQLLTFIAAGWVWIIPQFAPRSADYYNQGANLHGSQSRNYILYLDLVGIRSRLR
jgi:hypothetical protein